MMALHTLADDPQPAPNPPVQINVEDLMGQLSDVDLLQAADAYFARLNVGSEQCRNPLSNVADAIHITRNVSLLLQAVDVFPGADVLDFGCATGWLNLAQASLGCNAMGWIFPHPHLVWRKRGVTNVVCVQAARYSLRFTMGTACRCKTGVWTEWRALLCFTMSKFSLPLCVILPECFARGAVLQWWSLAPITRKRPNRWPRWRSSR